MGSMQATEAFKLIVGGSGPKMLTFNGFTNSFNEIEIRSKGKDCVVCIKGEVPPKVISPESNPPKMLILDPKYKVEWRHYLENQKKYVLIDIRDRISYEICRIKGSKSVPLEKIEEDNQLVKNEGKGGKKVIILCKRGRTSNEIVKVLNERGIECYGMDGGLKRFKREIDSSFPL
jgi:adenylyltransferase/sulfurtransferase